MTWTVTSLGLNNSNWSVGPFASVILPTTGSFSGVAAGDSIYIFGSYGTFGAGVPSVTDSASNSYGAAVNNVNETTGGQAYCDFQTMNISTAPANATMHFSPSQGFVGIGGLGVHNSVAGSPIVHNNTQTDNTASATTASGTVTASSGDLVIAVSGYPFSNAATSGVTMTGVTSPTLAISDGTTTGLACAYGVTTTTGTVTVQFTYGSAGPAMILLTTLTPPVAGAACVRGGLSLLGVGCALGAAKMLSDGMKDQTPRSRRSLWTTRGH